MTTKRSTGSHSDALLVRTVLDPACRASTMGPLAWDGRGSPLHIGTVEVYASALGLNGRLEIRVNELRGGQLWVSYIVDGGWVRRLCVNYEHRPFSGTHKHRVEVTGEQCYEPDDIPPIDVSPHTPPSAYREVLLAFAGECNVEVSADFVWSDPWGGA